MSKALTECLTKYFGEEYCIQHHDGMTLVLFVYPYSPYRQLRLDAYYPASHSAYLLARDCARELGEIGYTVCKFPHDIMLKPMAKTVGLAYSIGKNTLAYNIKYGSRFAIGTLAIEGYVGTQCVFYSGQAPNKCEDCLRCVNACPTGALSEAGLDRTKCLRALMDTDLGQLDEHILWLFGARVYGCDICQRACPRNTTEPIDAPPQVDSALDSILYNNDAAMLKELIGANMAKKTRFMNLLIIEAASQGKRELLPRIYELSKDPLYEQVALRAIKILEQD